jgi:DNA-binding FadR family transcriptional regulator
MTRAADAPSPLSPKLAAQVARRIESDIIAAGWPVGVLFGSETELRLRYRVSRAVLREAVRIVEHHGVADMRRGPAGGLIVRAPDAAPSARALVIYLGHLRTTIPDVVHARLLLEPLAAAMTARSITEEGIRRLRGSHAHEAAQPGMEIQDELHALLGELSGNAAVALFVQVLTLLTRHYASAHRPGEREVHQAKADSANAHRAIVEATIAGDVALAEHRVAGHLKALGRWLGTGPEPPVGGAGVTEPDTVHVKLAEIVADRIRSDISRAGLAEGELAGSEHALIVRYGVSRAVLREAIRLLEYHSVAGMRRGPGGGLIVNRPDPSASIEAIALYLEYQGIDFDGLRIVRDAIELGCIERVVARRGEPGVAERLRDAQRLDASTQAELEARSHVFHTELAELTGNPVLALFQRILTVLSARHLRATPSTVPSTGSVPTTEVMAAEVARVHGSIADAALAGDAGLAKHRMRRHLATLSTDWWH